MTRRSSPALTKRNRAIQERIEQIKADHPFWGYRRILAHLRFTEGQLVNRKRILRLMRKHQ